MVPLLVDTGWTILLVSLSPPFGKRLCGICRRAHKLLALFGLNDLVCGGGGRPFHLNVPPLPALVAVSLMLAPLFCLIGFVKLLGTSTVVPVTLLLANVMEVFIIDMVVLMSIH